MNDRTILHCDMNGFYASVELLDRPDLLDKPMAVCGNPENRHGIILAKNDLAKRFGVVTAETIWQAKQKCPDLQCVRPHHEKYKRLSKQINQIYMRYTDMVEPFSIDESWLDVTGSILLYGSGKNMADNIRETVKKELGLTLSVGVSFNKIFAKMGSEYKKPDATTVINRENYKTILWTMPVGELFFAGKATTEKLNLSGIHTIGGLAQSDPKFLASLLGKQGEMLYRYANGLDDSPVLRAHERQKIKSIGNGITFKRNLSGTSDIKTALTGLSDTVASRLRHHSMKACGIKVDIKDPYFKTISRQKQLHTATDLAEEINKVAFDIIKDSWNLNNPIRMLTITGIQLSDQDEEEQLNFFTDLTQNREKIRNIELAMDQVRAKFGQHAITFGSILKSDIGFDLDESKEE